VQQVADDELRRLDGARTGSKLTIPKTGSLPRAAGRNTKRSLTSVPQPNERCEPPRDHLPEAIYRFVWI